MKQSVRGSCALLCVCVFTATSLQRLHGCALDRRSPGVTHQSATGQLGSFAAPGYVKAWTNSYSPASSRRLKCRDYHIYCDRHACCRKVISLHRNMLCLSLTCRAVMSCGLAQDNGRLLEWPPMRCFAGNLRATVYPRESRSYKQWHRFALPRSTWSSL